MKTFQDHTTNAVTTNTTVGIYADTVSLLQLRAQAKDINLERLKKSRAISDGDSSTNFRGRGMEFAEVRPYQPGDDIRNIDWKVTARTQQTYTKLFQEEKERPIYIIVDQRSTMFFGSKRVFKSVLAAQIATIIAWAALNNKDRIGGLIFSDQTQKDCRARSGKHSALHFINELVTINNSLNSVANSAQTLSLYDILSECKRIAKPGSGIFIISDFHDINPQCREPLALISRHCDINLIRIQDLVEDQLFQHHTQRFTDTKNFLSINTNNKQLIKQYKNISYKRQQLLRQITHSSKVKLSFANTEKTIAENLRSIFITKKNTRARR